MRIWFAIAPRVFSAIGGFVLLALLLPQAVDAQLLPSFGRDRAGTAGFQFLKIAGDARSAAMGEAVSSNAYDASALFWNPALATRAPSDIEVGLAHTAYHADIALDYAALLYKWSAFTFGAHLLVLNSGQMPVTTEFQPFGTGETFRFVDWTAGLTVAQALTDLFSYGVTAKFVQERIASVTASTLVFDIGAFYQVGDTGLQMAVAIRHFGLDSTPSGSIDRISLDDPSGTVTETEFETLTPPTMFLLGVSYHIFDADDPNDLLVSVELSNPNDNAERLSIGAEYTWRDLLIFRAGYRFGVEEARLPTLGLGLHLPKISPEIRFDYGFSQLDRLGSVHRIGLNIRL